MALASRRTYPLTSDPPPRLRITRVSTCRGRETNSSYGEEKSEQMKSLTKVRKGWLAVVPVLAVGAFAPASALGASDLSITKTDSADPVVENTELTYTLQVSNAGPDAANGVQVVDDLPSQVDPIAATTTQGSCDTKGKKVTCELGALATGGAATVTIRVQPTKAGQLSNTASVTSTGADAYSENDADTEATTVVVSGGGGAATCGGKSPDILGTTGNDNLVGTPKNDVILALGGNDTVQGLGGKDIVCGAAGNDTIKGKAGNDLLKGGSGDDRIRGGGGGDVLRGGGGFDRLFGGTGADALFGGGGHDLCRGGGGSDTDRSC